MADEPPKICINIWPVPTVPLRTFMTPIIMTTNFDYFLHTSRLALSIAFDPPNNLRRQTLLRLNFIGKETEID